MSFPSSIDAPNTAQVGTTLVSTDDHALQHRTVGSAVIAIETKIGVGSGTPTANKVLIGSGNGTSTWGTSWDNATLGTPAITGGTITDSVINNPTLGTPIIGTVTVPGTAVPLSFSAAIAPGVGTITDTVGTLIVNAQQGQIFYSVMGTAAGNRTIGTPLNMVKAQALTYAFKASGSANGTLVWDTGAFTFSQDLGTPALGTGTSWNYYAWRYNAISSKFDFQGQSKNIA